MVLTRDDVADLREQSPKLEALLARHRAWWNLESVDRPLVTVPRSAGLQPAGRTYYVTLDDIPSPEQCIASIE